jgi:hypothetical protein
MAEMSIGELISGGGTLAFAMAVWWEVRTIRTILLDFNTRISTIEERTRADHTPTTIPLIGK